MPAPVARGVAGVREGELMRILVAPQTRLRRGHGWGAMAGGAQWIVHAASLDVLTDARYLAWAAAFDRSACVGVNLSIAATRLRPSQRTDLVAWHWPPSHPCPTLPMHLPIACRSRALATPAVNSAPPHQHVLAHDQLGAPTQLFPASARAHVRLGALSPSLFPPLHPDAGAGQHVPGACPSTRRGTRQHRQSAASWTHRV